MGNTIVETVEYRLGRQFGFGVVGEKARVAGR